MKDTVGRKAEELIEMLKAGKKVTVVGESKLYYVEDKNDPGSGNWTSTKASRTPILYFWCNPQMNRMFAKLSDRSEKDFALSFMDLYWNTFTEYIEEPKPEGWRDIFESRRMGNEAWVSCLLQAKKLKYKYICWNGRIYSTKDEYQAFPVCLEEEV